MRLRLAHNRVAIYVAVAILAALCAFAPTPYSLILPGRAVDLGDVVSLDGGRPAQTHLYLTDVRFATRVTPLELLSAFLPGVRVVQTNDILPSGVSMVRYEGVEREAMSESQTTAAAVAERAAGYRVPSPRSRMMVVYFVPHSRASQMLRPLDILVAVDGKSIASSSDVRDALRGVKAGAVVRVGLFRNGGRRIAPVQTTAYRGRTILGTYLTTIYDRPRLPVGVSFHLPHVAGSSGGLMFALEIYRSLKRQQLPGDLRIAGTGTIAYDGSVGPIEGATQKVAAARAAGASLFLVPAENYAEIKDTRNIHVVPVASFNQAVHAVASAAIPQ